MLTGSMMTGGRRPSRTNRTPGEETSQRISRAFVQIVILWNSGTGPWGFGIIRVMYAQLAKTVAGNKQTKKNKQANNTVCSVRTTIFLLQRQMIYSQPVILAAIVAKLSFSLFSMQLCEQDQSRGRLHDSRTDCWEVSEALRQRLELSSAILH